MDEKTEIVHFISSLSRKGGGLPKAVQLMLNNIPASKLFKYSIVSQAFKNDESLNLNESKINVNIIIYDHDDAGHAVNNDGELPTMTYDEGAGDWYIGELAIESSGSSIVLAASGSITMDDLSDNDLLDLFLKRKEPVAQLDTPSVLHVLKLLRER